MAAFPSGPMSAANTQPIQTEQVGPSRPTAAMLRRPTKKKKKEEKEMPPASPQPNNASMLTRRK